MRNLLSNLSIKNCAKPIIQTCAFVIITHLVTGCSSVPKKEAVPLMSFETEDFITLQKAPNTNQPVQIRSSVNDNRPEWTHKSSFEQNNAIYFTGVFLNGADYSVTLRAANAEALKSVIMAVGQYVRSEFSMYTKGSNNIKSGIDRYLDDGIATFANNFHIQGIRQIESYYEEMWDTVSQKPFYNIWVKLEISKSDYLRAKARVIKKIRNDFNTAGELEAKEKAQKLLNDLKGQINESV